MMETLVSIMPLVENRDYWKRRALLAEAQLTTQHGVIESRKNWNLLIPAIADGPDINRNVTQALERAVYNFAQGLLDSRMLTLSLVNDKPELQLDMTDGERRAGLNRYELEALLVKLVTDTTDEVLPK